MFQVWRKVQFRGGEALSKVWMDDLPRVWSVQVQSKRRCRYSRLSHEKGLRRSSGGEGETKLTKDTASTRAVRASKIGVFGALYVATSLIPISVFIGAPSFLGLNLVITPVIALLLPPMEALYASLFGGLIAFYVAPMQAMFGPYTILLPIAGATFGSLTSHRTKLGTLTSALYLVVAISAYLIKNYPFPYFTVPHLLAILVALAGSFKSKVPLRTKIPMYTYVSTMCEQGMMMILAVYLLGLPWPVFPGILPLMIYERAIATAGASSIVLGIIRFMPKYFGATISPFGVEK